MQYKELFNEYLAFLDINQNYDLAYTEQDIKENLNKEKFKIFERLLVLESEKVKAKDYARQSIIYFLLEDAKKNRNKSKYVKYCSKFENILEYKKKELIKDYSNLTEDALIVINPK